VLQSKYANPREDAIPLERRFVCCVDMYLKDAEPSIYVFPASVVAKGLHYYFNSNFPNSPSYHLSLDFRPQGKSKENAKTVGEFIDAQRYIENFGELGLVPVLQ